MQATRRPTATSEKGVRGCVVQRVKVWGAGRERGGDFKAECVLHVGATGDANEIVSIVFPRRGIIPFSGG